MDSLSSLSPMEDQRRGIVMGLIDLQQQTQPAVVGGQTSTLALDLLVQLNRLFLDEALLPAPPLLSATPLAQPPLDDAVAATHAPLRKKRRHEVQKGKEFPEFDSLAHRCVDVLIPMILFRTHADPARLLSRHVLQLASKVFTLRHQHAQGLGKLHALSQTVDELFGTNLQCQFKLAPPQAPAPCATDRMPSPELQPAALLLHSTTERESETASTRMLSPMSDVSASCFTSTFPCAGATGSRCSGGSGGDEDRASPTVQSIVERLRLPPPPPQAPLAPLIVSDRCFHHESSLSMIKRKAPLSVPAAGIGRPTSTPRPAQQPAAATARSSGLPLYLLRKRGRGGEAPLQALTRPARNDDLVVKPSVHRTTCMSSPYMSRAALRDCSNSNSRQVTLAMTTVPKTPPPEPRACLFADDDDLDFVPPSPL